MTSSRTLRVVLAGLLALLLSSACSGQEQDSGPADGATSDSGSTSGSAGEAGSGSEAGAPGPVADSSGGQNAREVGGKAAIPPGSVSQAAVLRDNRSLIRTAALTVRVEAVRQAADRARTIAQTAGGELAGETTTSVDAGSATATLTLRVPPERLDGVVADLAKLGKELDRRLGTTDVTEQVIDVESRLASSRASVTRLRALLARAQTVGEVVAVEGQLAAREAELESLQARQRALDDQVSLATVTLLLVGPQAPAPRDDDEEGFLAGLQSGWSAFQAATLAVLTGLGALLPFLALALVLGGASLVVRSRLRVRRTPDPVS